MNETLVGDTSESVPRVEVAEFLNAEPPEVTEAKALAKRYRLPFIDLLPPEAGAAAENGRRPRTLPAECGRPDR